MWSSGWATALSCSRLGWSSAGSWVGGALIRRPPVLVQVLLVLAPVRVLVLVLVRERAAGPGSSGARRWRTRPGRARPAIRLPVRGRWPASRGPRPPRRAPRAAGRRRRAL